jgi:hypothetical protein
MGHGAAHRADGDRDALSPSSAAAGRRLVQSGCFELTYGFVSELRMAAINDTYFQTNRFEVRFGFREERN